MRYQIVRVLRTNSSERFVFQDQNKDVAGLELHYMQNNVVAGTLIVFEGCGLKEEDIPEFLREVDQVLLPEVSLEDENLSFTVIVGRVLGSYVPHSLDAPAR